MKLFVTGGAGFIGSNFIKFWLERHPEDQIVNFDKLTYAGCEDNLKGLEKPQYEFVKGDIVDYEAVKKAMTGADWVVHFAAESHVDRSIDNPDIFVKTNVLGTQTLINAALKTKIKRFHHISTDEVFGALSLETSQKFSETTPYNPHSPYSASKAGSDHLVRAAYTTYGLPATISNCSNNYGPFQFPEKLIPLVITNLIDSRKVTVYGDGLHVRDWLHVDDHCRAIALILEKGRVGETYCVGGLTDDINNLGLVKKILRFFGQDESQIEFVKDRPGHDRRYAVDWSKIHRELGWQPKYELNTGLETTIDWYRQNEWWWRPLKEKIRR